MATTSPYTTRPTTRFSGQLEGATGGRLSRVPSWMRAAYRNRPLRVAGTSPGSEDEFEEFLPERRISSALQEVVDYDVEGGADESPMGTSGWSDKSPLAQEQEMAALSKGWEYTKADYDLSNPKNANRGLMGLLALGKYVPGIVPVAQLGINYAQNVSKARAVNQATKNVRDMYYQEPYEPYSVRKEYNIQPFIPDEALSLESVPGLSGVDAAPGEDYSDPSPDSPHDVDTDVEGWGEDTSTVGEAGYGTGEVGEGEGNAASGGDDGGDGTVLCTELNRQGLLPDDIFRADTEYGRSVDPIIMEGYHFWGVPLASLMRKSRVVTAIVRPLVHGWACHVAYKMGVVEKDNLTGVVLEAIGVPICRWIGAILKEVRSNADIKSCTARA